MVLLLDIGNTNTHVGLADTTHVRKRAEFPTNAWSTRKAELCLKKFTGNTQLEGAAVCSVVPHATERVFAVLRRLTSGTILKLTARTVRTTSIDYPTPDKIGPDRLANAVAALHRFGVPVVVVDFGTAVTIDVVDARGYFIGGVIAPGLAALTDYMHERTALLPRVRFRRVRRAIGRSTKEAMLLGATYALTGLVREALRGIRRQLKTSRLRVVATGGCAKLICPNLPEVTAVVPELTLDGLRIEWYANWLES